MSNCTNITPKEAWDFILSVEDGSEVFMKSRAGIFLSSWFCNTKQLGSSLLNSLFSAAIVIIYLAIGIVKLGTGAMPYLLYAGSQAVRFHKEQLTWVDLLFEGVLVAGIITFYIFRQEIHAYFDKLEKSIARSSRFAKTTTTRLIGVAPHVGMFFIAIVCAFLGSKFLKPFSAFHIMPIFSLMLPIVLTCWSCLSMRNREEQFTVTALGTAASRTGTRIGKGTGTGGERGIGEMDDISTELLNMPAVQLQELASSGRSKLMFWCVLTVYHAVATVLKMIPFSVQTLDYLPFVRESLLVIFILSLVSPVYIEILYEMTSWVLTLCSRYIPSSSSEEEYGSRIIGFLRGMNMISSRTELFFKAFLVEGMALVILVIFTCMPFGISNFGVLILALILPAIRSSLVIRAWEVVTPFTSPKRSPLSSTGTGKGSAMKTSSSMNDNIESEAGSDGSTWSYIYGATVSTSSSMLAALRNMSPEQPLRTESSLLSEESVTAAGAGAGTVRFSDVTDEIDADTTLSSGGSRGSLRYDNSRGAGGSSSDTPGRCTFTVGTFSSNRKIQKNSVEACRLIQKQTRWLEYFVCVGCIWALRCYDIKLWSSLTMILCWYLSHSMLSGATKPARTITNIVEFIPVAITPLLTLRMVRGMCRYMGRLLLPSYFGDPNGIECWTPIEKSSRSGASSSACTDPGTPILSDVVIGSSIGTSSSPYSPVPYTNRVSPGSEASTSTPASLRKSSGGGKSSSRSGSRSRSRSRSVDSSSRKSSAGRSSAGSAISGGGESSTKKTR